MTEKIAPDLLWIDKGTYVYPETLKKIKNFTKKIQIIHHCTDDIETGIHKFNNYLNSLDLYDAHFTSNKFNIDYLKKISKSHFFYNALGYDHNIFYPNNGEKEYDLCFIGHYEPEYEKYVSVAAKKEINFFLGGEGWGSSAISKSKISFTRHNEKICPEIVANSWASLGLYSSWNRNVYSGRVLEIPAQKTVLIVKRNNFIETLYNEDSEAHPKSYYGETKKQMEKLVLEANANAIVIRPGILYGFNAPDGKDKLVTPVIDKINKCEEIVINDLRPKYPVIIDDVPNNALTLIEKNEKGIFNFASEEKVDRYTSAIIVAKEFGLDETKIKKDEPQEFPDKPYDVQLKKWSNVKMKIIKFNELEPIHRDDGRDIYSLTEHEISGNAKFFRVKIPAGTLEKEHYHENSDEIFIFLGNCKVTINSEEHNIQSGDLVILEKNDKHMLEAVEDTELIGIKVPDINDKVIVEFAMRYGNPSIKSKLNTLKSLGCENIIILPLYPKLIS